MSIELEDAKTKVAQFQKQCEEYLVVIVQQKRDADDQQKVEILFHSTTSLLRLIIGLPVASKKTKQNKIADGSPRRHCINFPTPHFTFLGKR